MLGRRGGGKIRCGRMAVSSLAHAAGSLNDAGSIDDKAKC